MQPYRQQPTRLLCPWDSPGKNTGVGCHFLSQCMKVKSESEVAQSCPTLSDPMDCSLPGSSIHGIFQARVLKWVAIAFSKNSHCIYIIYGKVCVFMLLSQFIPPSPSSTVSTSLTSISVSPLLLCKQVHQYCLSRFHTCAQLLQSCPTLCNPMDCSSPGSSVHGILQAIILE